MFGPDAYPRDPYGWVTNQAGHAAIVGIAMGGALLWLPPIPATIIAASVYFIVWEWAYQIVALGSKLYRDAVADTINVAMGAGLAGAVGLVPAFWAIWGAWLLILCIGAAYRR